ncbi:MAG: DEAD/DEAH box helicase [Lachnospiraceae bacterium]|nr:DEAD/DEAH box helicase [Lachnospiraceae bacterium]
MEKSLYQWQEECLKRWLSKGARGMVQAVTGSGKTYLAMCAVDALEEKLGQKVFVKIVVPTSALMNQWAKALREHLASKEEGESCGSATCNMEAGRETSENSIGLRGGGYKDPANRRYMIYVINSARYELARQTLKQLENGEPVFLIADECHHYARGENSVIFEFQDRISMEKAPWYSLGLSATLPWGQEGAALTKALGPRIYTYGMSKAASLKTVSAVDIFHVSLSFREEELEDYEEISDEMLRYYTQLLRFAPALGKMNLRERFEEIRRLSAGKDRIGRLARKYLNLTWQRRKLVCLASDRIACAQELIRRLPQNEKIMIFGERIAQAEELYQLLYREYPGRAGRCHSEMGEQANRNTLERFRTGEFRILVTCKSMDEGVNIPDASVGIILSGTSVQRQRTQRMGRVIRRAEGKERAALYYLHVTESAEDDCYLPDTGDSRIFEIAFVSGRKNFSHPEV